MYNWALVERTSERHESADLRVVTFVEPQTGRTHLALVYGDVTNVEDVPVWVRASCEPSVMVARAPTLFEREVRGVLVCFGARCEASSGPERSGSDEHEYVVAADILRELRVRSVRLSRTGTR